MKPITVVASDAPMNKFVNQLRLSRNNLCGALIMSAVVALGLLESCSGFAYKRKITAPYIIVAVDEMEQMNISRELPGGSAIGRIPQKVFAVGCNQRFIVAKRRPVDGKVTTEYYILRTWLDNDYAEPEKSVEGPLTETQYLIRKSELSLPEFTINAR